MYCAVIYDLTFDLNTCSNHDEIIFIRNIARCANLYTSVDIYINTRLYGDNWPKTRLDNSTAYSHCNSTSNLGLRYVDEYEYADRSTMLIVRFKGVHIV